MHVVVGGGDFGGIGSPGVKGGGLGGGTAWSDILEYM